MIGSGCRRRAIGYDEGRRARKVQPKCCHGSRMPRPQTQTRGQPDATQYTADKACFGLPQPRVGCELAPLIAQTPPPPGSKACAFQHEGLRIDIRALVPFVDTGWMVRGKQAGMQVMFRVCLNFLLQHACPLQNPLQGPCLLCTHWHRWWSRSMMFLRVSGRRPANSCTSTKVCTRSTAGRGWRL